MGLKQKQSKNASEHAIENKIENNDDNEQIEKSCQSSQTIDACDEQRCRLKNKIGKNQFIERLFAKRERFVENSCRPSVCNYGNIVARASRSREIDRGTWRQGAFDSYKRLHAFDR